MSEETLIQEMEALRDEVTSNFWNMAIARCVELARKHTPSEMLDNDDVEALLIAYDHAKEQSLPLTAIQPNIDIVRTLLAQTPKRESGEEYKIIKRLHESLKSTYPIARQLLSSGRKIDWKEWEELWVGADKAIAESSAYLRANNIEVQEGK